jgi:hypothetical protein
LSVVNALEGGAPDDTGSSTNLQTVSGIVQQAVQYSLL